jgi:hypothetical protein
MEVGAEVRGGGDATRNERVVRVTTVRERERRLDRVLTSESVGAERFALAQHSKRFHEEITDRHRVGDVNCQSRV